MSVFSAAAATILAMCAMPDPPPSPPGMAYLPREHAAAAGALLVSSFTSDAGCDESFLLVGEGLTGELDAWGLQPYARGGGPIQAAVKLNTPGLLMGTVSQGAYEGPIVVWAKNKSGYSEPVVLNAPEPWWCLPETAAPGAEISIFGRNLAQRPDFHQAFVYLARPGKAGVWLNVREAGKYRLRCELPQKLEAGSYQLWLHAGNGGVYGWGGPLSLEVSAEPRAAAYVADFQGENLQRLIDGAAAAGGGTVRIPEGNFVLPGALVVPAGVRIVGAGRERSTLRISADPATPLVTAFGAGWNRCPDGVHDVGAEMSYHVQFPADGEWAVWLRYGTHMDLYGRPGMSKCTTISLDGREPVWLDNLPNTGDWHAYKWSRSATVHVSAGRHALVWKNMVGGGIGIDAMVFSSDPHFTPGDAPFPSNNDKTVVLQGESCERFLVASGRLPEVDRPVVWLSGDGASVADLTLRGTPRNNVGIVVASPAYPRWIHACAVRNVCVCGCEARVWPNSGIHLCNAEGATVSRNEFWGSAPLLLSGVERCRLESNRLVAQSLTGGNAEAYILSGNDRVHKCIIEDNVCACPTGAEAGGPTGRRILWFSTGRGSVEQNWIAGNREDKARFGGIAATDQNVGEMILFEGCQRIAYFGPAAAAGGRSLTLPATLPPTPAKLLVELHRDQLAHDAAGRETPFWPPEIDDGGSEPTVGEYFVTVLRGRGLGQTRHVVGRKGETYLLDRPWRVTPQPGSLVLVHTGFWRNHVVRNRTVDGMCGIQFWIACIENIVSDNDVGRMRKDGVMLYADCSNLASSMPLSWNRGIGPLYFNQVEGVRCDETNIGVTVLDDEFALPIEFPRGLGNVVRHNSLVRSRHDGVSVAVSNAAKEPQPAAAMQGTIVEYNVVRDAAACYHVGQSVDATMLRRNHAYAWGSVGPGGNPPVAFQIDREKATAVLELNTTEGREGVWNTSELVPVLRGGKRLPDEQERF